MIIYALYRVEELVMRNIRKSGLPFHQKRSIIASIVENALLERLDRIISLLELRLG
jgi:hypothetical protein